MLDFGTLSFVYWKRKGILANSVDPDEMQHNAAFHQGLNCLLQFNQSSWKEIHHYLENSTQGPLKYTMCSPILSYCINVYGKIHQNTKG